MKYLVLALFLCGCAAPAVYQELPPEAPLPIPRSAPRPIRQKQKFIALTNPAMVQNASFDTIVSQEEDTNSYYYVPLQWTYPTNQLSGTVFRVYHGTNSHAYTAFIDVGASLNYEFMRTNWALESVPRYFAVTAIRYGLESDYSRELRWPLYAPDRVVLSWLDPAPLEILISPNLMFRSELWQSFYTTPAGATSFTWIMQGPSLFFRTRRPGGAPEVLTIFAFNPLNFD